MESTLGDTDGTKDPWSLLLGGTDLLTSTEGAKVGTDVSWSLPLGDRDWV